MLLTAQGIEVTFDLNEDLRFDFDSASFSTTGIQSSIEKIAEHGSITVSGQDIGFLLNTLLVDPANLTIAPSVITYVFNNRYIDVIKADLTVQGSFVDPTWELEYDELRITMGTQNITWAFQINVTQASLSAQGSDVGLAPNQFIDVVPASLTFFSDDIAFEPLPDLDVVEATLTAQGINVDLTLPLDVAQASLTAQGSADIEITPPDLGNMMHVVPASLSITGIVMESYLSGDFEEFVTHAPLQLYGILVGLNRIFVSQDNYGKIEGQTAYVMEEYAKIAEPFRIRSTKKVCADNSKNVEHKSK